MADLKEIVKQHQAEVFEQELIGQDVARRMAGVKVGASEVLLVNMTKREGARA